MEILKGIYCLVAKRTWIVLSGYVLSFWLGFLNVFFHNLFSSIRKVWGDARKSTVCIGLPHMLFPTMQSAIFVRVEIGTATTVVADNTCKYLLHFYYHLPFFEENVCTNLSSSIHEKQFDSE